MVQTARILAIAALLLLTAGGAVGAEEQQLTFKGGVKKHVGMVDVINLMI